jgi:hypothetical protein
VEMDERHVCYWLSAIGYGLFGIDPQPIAHSQ